MNSHRFLTLRSLALAALALAAGCRASAPPSGAVAECPVCAREGDLACLRVEVGPDTPSCTCDGELYHFCSEECRAEFEKHPQRYVER